MTMGVVDRMIRRSVERAGRMQPRRVQQSVDETLFASPSQRADVERLRSASRTLVDMHLAIPGHTMLAVRRTEHSLTVNRSDADLASLDARSLITIDLRDPQVDDVAPCAEHAIRLMGDALSVVVAHPAALLALGEIPDGTQHGLHSEARVHIEPGVGVVAIGADPPTLVMAMTAAERAAEITLTRRNT